MSKSLGDFDASAVIYGKFTTYRPSSGANFTLAGTPALSVYKDNSTTQSTSGFTLTADFDSVTGLNHFAIDTSADGTFYSAGSFFDIVITAGTVDSVSVVGSVVASFTIRKNSALKPATAGRTVVVDAAGLVDANTVKLGPSGSGTAQTARDIGTSVLLSSGTGTGQISLASGGVSLSTSGLNAAADAVLDEAMSGHVAAGSLGAALQPTDQGTAQAGGANTITLRSGASASNDYYNKQLLKIVAGTGAGQSEYISDYVGATKVATMGASWITTPDNTSVYVVEAGGTIPGASAPTAAEVADAVLDEAMSGHTSAGTLGQYLNAGITRTGTAQAGTTNSITLDAGASATNNLYRYHGVEIIGGTGAGEASFITGYTGSSKVATVDPAFAVAPDSTSVFALRKFGIDAATPSQVATAVWAATRSGNATAGTFGEYVFADATRLSGDATAADNAEAFFDGTGYAGTNNVIPTVTTVTTVSALANNSITAAATAADYVTEVQSGLATAAALSTVSTNVDAILADTGTDGVVVAAASKTGYALSTTGIDALFTRQLTESYAADGAAPTVAQSLMIIQQLLGDFSISGTTLTLKKVDGTTTAATFTLNSASAPTSITRAT